ncbi:MAG: dipicolinate synthase subunit DpsA [Clostridia bacterium]|nr:dipicolinate synthase subunit DpsA [Clostridia bacterium]
MQFTIVGGDLRQLYAARYLQEKGAMVTLVGWERCPQGNLRDLHLRKSDELISPKTHVLLPFPAEGADETINAPFAVEPIPIQAFLRALAPKTSVFTGKLGMTACATATEKALCVIDYSAREDFLVKNAIPSAEGAIQLALEQLPRTLHNANCLVVGYGRIGKILAAQLRGLGARVTVSARKAADRAWIAAFGYRPLVLSPETTGLDSFDAVFNTVPAPILTEPILNRLRRDCLIIDLASKPGGTDFEAAKRLGLSAIHALALPGKVAPQTAGETVAETVLAILNEACQ